MAFWLGDEHGRPSEFAVDWVALAATVASIDRSDPSACWLWPGHRSARGYAMVKTSATDRPVHRLLWEARHGPLPPGWVVHHLCGQRACVNDDHLWPMRNGEHVSLHHALRRAA